MRPVFLYFGPIPISSYGLFTTLALILGLFLAWREVFKKRLNEELIFDIFLYSIIIGLVIGRIFFILLNFSEFNLSPLRWILFTHFFGFSLWPTFFTFFISLYLFAKKKELSFWQLCDITVFSLSASMVVYKIGTFFAAVDIGAPTNLPWGVYMSGFTKLRHPVQLYEAIYFLFSYILLTKAMDVFIKNNLVQKPSTLLFFILFSFDIFIFGFLRAEQPLINGLALDQWIAIPVFFLSCIFFYILVIGRLKLNLNLKIKLPTKRE